MSPGRIRAHVATTKAETIRQMLSEINTLPLETQESFVADRRMIAAGESFLRRALEALLDLGRHMLAKGFGVPAAEYKQIAAGLEEREVLSRDEADLLSRMAGYRNRLVHFYDEVSPGELYTILADYRGDLARILAALEPPMSTRPENSAARRTRRRLEPRESCRC